MPNSNKITDHKFLLVGGCLFILLMAAFGVTTIWFAPSQALRIVFGTFFAVFLPGFVMSFVFFPNSVSMIKLEDDQRDGQEELPALDWVERITLSFALSLSAVPLLIYLSNRMGLPVSTASVAGIILFIITISLIAIFLNRRRHEP